MYQALRMIFNFVNPYLVLHQHSRRKGRKGRSRSWLTCRRSSSCRCRCNRSASRFQAENRACPTARCTRSRSPSRTSSRRQDIRLRRERQWQQRGQHQKVLLQQGQCRQQVPLALLPVWRHLSVRWPVGLFAEADSSGQRRRIKWERRQKQAASWSTSSSCWGHLKKFPLLFLSSFYCQF